MIRTGLLFALCLLMAGCTTSPPRNPDNLCDIFREKDDWYDDAAKARDNWGSPIPTMMAIMFQESKFEAKARPARRKVLGFIPWTRPSDAYGYSQAKTGTWKEYKREAGSYGADRDDFADSVDFIGWYNNKSGKRSGISPNNTYGLYLAYHEGHGGYNRGTWKSKQWLQNVARKVERRAGSYQSQLAGCEEDLKDKGWFFGWF
ncbi:transglycosylase SLT domain-containing protein [Haliea sp. E17]|uniref:transglycosylase SLT domain-containing protein n=1 Tax=Haliea sp. E17 TaxID=3401576 RepID=UPI003AADBB01